MCLAAFDNLDSILVNSVMACTDIILTAFQFNANNVPRHFYRHSYVIVESRQRACGV